MARKIYTWDRTWKDDFDYITSSYRLLLVDDKYLIQRERYAGFWVDSYHNNTILEFFFAEDARKFIINFLSPQVTDSIVVGSNQYALHQLKQYERDRFGDYCIVSCNGVEVTDFDSIGSKHVSLYGSGSYYYVKGDAVDVKKRFWEVVESREPSIREEYAVEQKRIAEEKALSARRKREEEEDAQRREKQQHLLNIWKENSVILDIIPRINNNPWLPKLPRIIRGERYAVLNQLLKTVYEYEDRGNICEANAVARVLEAQHQEAETAVTTFRDSVWVDGDWAVITLTGSRRRKPREIRELCKQKITVRI